MAARTRLITSSALPIRRKGAADEKTKNALLGLSETAFSNAAIART